LLGRKKITKEGERSEKEGKALCAREKLKGREKIVNAQGLGTQSQSRAAEECLKEGGKKDECGGEEGG